MTNNYEYMDESYIEISLKCIICSDPYINPCSTPCDHTFCRSCITKWIGENDRCPACGKKPITILGLRATNRVVFDILDRLLVRCNDCRQSNIQRGNFDEHSNKCCLETFVSCSAADLKCPWQGPRDELQAHLTVCHYEMMRPLLGNLLNTVNNLTEKVQQYDNRLDLLQTENNRLKDEVNSLKNFCTDQISGMKNLSGNDVQRRAICSQLNERMEGMQILPNPTVDHNPRLEQIISRCQSFSTVMLNDLRLDYFDIPFIIHKALITKQCSVLSLSNNFIEPNGMELLANGLRTNVRLKRLILKGNRAGFKGVEFLAAALLTNDTLEVLELQANDIPDTAAKLLADMLRHNHTLKDLFLDHNSIESQGMELMANALDNKSTLEILSVSGNKLDDKCIDVLDRTINKNQKLKQLDLHYNKISLEGKNQLLHIFNGKKGFKLNI